jgi:hypothetical protein
MSECDKLPAMKYYIYISDAKVDMLLEQLDETKTKKIVTELGFNWKLFSAKRTVEANTEKNRTARVETVVSFLQKYGNLSNSVDEPDQFVSDTMPMDLNVLDGDGKSPLMYLNGETEKTIVGLGGSSKFMLGADLTAITMPRSNSGQILHVLRREFDKGQIEKDKEDDVLGTVFSARMLSNRPTEVYEFVAKRLVYSPTYRGMGVLLATPLYVAMVS